MTVDAPRFDSCSGVWLLPSKLLGLTNWPVELLYIDISSVLIAYQRRRGSCLIRFDRTKRHSWFFTLRQFEQGGPSKEASHLIRFWLHRSHAVALRRLCLCDSLDTALSMLSRNVDSIWFPGAWSLCDDPKTTKFLHIVKTRPILRDVLASTVRHIGPGSSFGPREGCVCLTYKKGPAVLELWYSMKSLFYQ